MNRNYVLGLAVLSIAACGQAELPDLLPKSEYVHIADRTVSLRGETFTLAQRPTSSGTNEQFVRVGGRYFKCTGDGTLEERCLRAAERAKNQEDMGDDY